MNESSLLHRILLTFGSGAVRLFRRQVGTLWAGSARRIAHKGMYPLEKGDVVLKNAQAIPVGIKGESDLGGWVSHVVTQADVGRKLAIFLAVECKSDKGRVRPEQADFITIVQRAGGIAGLARSEKDVRDLLTNAQSASNLHSPESGDTDDKE